MNKYSKVFTHPALHVRILSLLSSVILLIVGNIFSIRAPEGVYYGAMGGILFGLFFWLEIRHELKTRNYYPVTLTQMFSYTILIILYSVVIGCFLEKYIPDFSSPAAGSWLGWAFHFCIGFLIAYTCIQLLVLSLHLYRYGILERQVWKERQTGNEGMVDLVGIVTKQLDPEGRVLVRGEIWAGISRTRVPIEVGTKVKVEKVEGLKLYVSPISPGSET